MKDIEMNNRRVEHEGVVFHYDGKFRGDGRVKVYRVYGDVSDWKLIEDGISLDIAALLLEKATAALRRATQ